MGSNLPRTDVGGGGLAGLLAAVLLAVLNGDVYNFGLWAAFFGAVVVFAAGYVPREHKNFAMSVAAIVGTLIAWLVGYLFYGQQADQVAVSFAVTSLVVALVAYLAPPNAQSEIINSERSLNRRDPS